MVAASLAAGYALSVEGDLSVPERAPPSGLPANVTVISIHPMYGADQICFATFLGGPLGGGWLMALNYKRLGEPAKAQLATALSVLAMAALVAIGLAIPHQPTLLLLWFLPTFAMCGLAQSLQGAAYDRHVAAGGSRGSTWRVAGLGVVSLAMCCGGTVFYEVATTPDAVISGPMHETIIGGSSVFYTLDVTRAEAQRVGEELAALEYLPRKATWGGVAPWSVVVTRDGDRRVVAFSMVHRPSDDVQRRYHRLAELLSREVYDGAPVDIWLTDDEMQRCIKLPWESRPR
jgi:hypothetical protein